MHCGLGKLVKRTLPQRYAKDIPKQGTFTISLFSNNTLFVSLSFLMDIFVFFPCARDALPAMIIKADETMKQK